MTDHDGGDSILFSVVNACVVIGVGGIMLSGMSIMNPLNRVKGATMSSRLQWIQHKQAQQKPLTEGEQLLLEQLKDCKPGE